MQITILTDISSWMNPYSKQLADKLRERGANVSVVHSVLDVLQGELLFLLSCFQLINKATLQLNHHNIVVHASALPAGKGWSPTTWQILEGKNLIPLTLFEAVEEMDAGNVYQRSSIPLTGNELLPEIRHLLGTKIVSMCLEFVANYDRKALGQKQQGLETRYLKRKPKDSELDIHKPIKEQFNLLRVVDNENYPAFFVMNGTKYILKIYKE